MPSIQTLPCIAFICHSIFLLSLSLTNRDHEYITDLEDLLENAKSQHNDAIIGNPLLTEKCANSILNEHQQNLDDLQYKGFATPWFWSRESLDATIRELPLHRRLKITHASSNPAFEPESEYLLPWSTVISNKYNVKHHKMPGHISRWYDRLGQTSNTGNTYSDDYASLETKRSNLNDPKYRKSAPETVYYYHIPKTGSSSIGSILSSRDYNRSYTSENILSHTQCGFTFVREPISRFVSGYYTVNNLIYFHNIPGKSKKRYNHDKMFKWYNISGEPARFTQFVEDMIEHGFEFIRTSPLEHMESQIGRLAVAQNDIHFIGRLSKLRDHWQRLVGFCDTELLEDYPEKDVSRMKNYGVKGIKDEPEYARLMGLENYENGDVLPAYKVVADSYDLYSQIAGYYKQDFVCLGFEMDYVGFRNKIYDKWDLMMQRKGV